MNQNLDAERAALLLAKAVSSVFAEVAFIDVEPLPVAQSIREDHCAAIDVLLPLSCRIELRIRQALLDRIAESLFPDMEEQEKKRTAADSLLEMLNILAGIFLSSYFGQGTEIQLELPRYLYFGEQTAGQPVAAISMDAEGEPVSVLLTSVRYRY
jgi:hypothetical protein